MTFPEHECGRRCNSQIVDRCTGSCLACRQTHTNYFENGEIISSSHDSSSRISTISGFGRHFRLSVIIGIT